MIVHAAEQGTLAWLEARLGRATASNFSKILTPTGKLSKSREAYLAGLLAEYFLGEPIEEFHGTEWTERGSVLEPDAFEYYAFHRDVDPEKVGFIYRDEDRLVGCSPDGLVGDDGLIELKCPKAGTHLLYLAHGVVPSTYLPQVQGQLWVTGREWCDFMSYYPGLPPFIVRAHPDERYQAGLDAGLPQFCEEMLDSRARLEKMGVPRDTTPLMDRRVVPTGQPGAGSSTTTARPSNMKHVVEAAEAAFRTEP